MNLNFSFQIKTNMHKIKIEPTAIVSNECSSCQTRLTAEIELLKRIDDREAEILNLKQEILNFKCVNKSLQQDLDKKDTKL